MMTDEDTVRVRFNNGAEATVRARVGGGLTWRSRNAEVERALNRFQQASRAGEGGHSHAPTWNAAVIVAERFGGTVLGKAPAPPPGGAGILY